MPLPGPYLSHWVADQDQPWYPPGSDVFRLFEPNGRQVICWEPGEHVPCWLDFLPNRDARALFHLCRGDPKRLGIPADEHGPVDVPPGPLRQSIRKVMWRLA